MHIAMVLCACVWLCYKPSINELTETNEKTSHVYLNPMLAELQGHSPAELFNFIPTV